MACCPPGSTGPAKLSSESLKGQMETIESEIPCYCSGSPLESSKRVVLLYTDVFGIDTGHHKAIADRLAEKLGTKTSVLIPDFFRGKPIVKHTSWLPLAINVAFLYFPQILWNCKFRVTDKSLEKDITKVVLPWLRKKTNGTIDQTGFSCVGFCFGGWLVGMTLALPDVPAKCGIGIHPAFKVEKLNGRSEIDLAVKIGSKPILLLPAGNDDLKPGNAVVDTLAEARGVSPEEVSIPFPTMIHGWVTRGDSEDPEINECQNKALQLTVDFIEKHHPV